MRKIIVFILMAFLISSNILNAATITGNAPVITSVNVGGTNYTVSASDDINTYIKDAFDLALLDANKALEGFKNQDKLAKGFGNANAYASHAATLQGYQDYDIFAITTGAMIGVQMPSANLDYYNDFEKKIEEDKDLYAGISAGIAWINAGINAELIYPGLYLNVKFGHISKNLDNVVEGLSVSNTLIGIGANYSWIRSTDIGFGIIKWRGLSLGSGVYYNKSQVNLDVKLDKTTAQPIATASNVGGSGEDITGGLVLDPSFTLGVKQETVTIPFDITTSVRLLWFLNFNLGAGLDINFGSSDIILKSSAGDVYPEITTAPGTVYTITPGTITVDGSTKNGKPSILAPRITTGVGLNIAPVKIDIPVIYYPRSGFAVGLTAGVVW